MTRLARTITLFSGGGTLEVALRDLIEPVVAVEYDPKIAAHYASVHGDHVLNAKVEDVDYVELNTVVPNVDYLHASPVCKQASAAKTGGGEDEINIATALGVARAIEALRPIVVTIENVPNYRKFRSLQIILSALNDSGYNHDMAVYEAADYGSPSRRERLLVRAVRGATLPPAPAGQPAPRKDWHALIRDLIPTMPVDSEPLPDFLRERLDKANVDWHRPGRPLLVAGGSGFSGSVPYSWPGGPSFVMKATPNEKHRLIMPDGERRAVTPRVIARLMGLPDDYPLPERGGRTQRGLAITIVGNGMPVPLTRALVGSLLRSQQHRFHGQRS